jgi:beta-lactamase class A
MMQTKRFIKWSLLVYSIIITLYALTLTFNYNPFSEDAQNADSLDSKKKKETGLKEIRTGGYLLINPLLDCYELTPSKMRVMKEAESKIKAYIAEVKQEKNLETVSVYVRDLSNGPWFGINEDSVYSPASLLKVPVLIAALKEAQQDGSFFTRKTLFDPEQKNKYSANIQGEKHIQPGNSYTMKELMESMIVYSDNDAADLLIRNISRENYNEVFLELGIDLSKHAPADNFLSVKEYAAFFRILYNATHLNKNMSEKALALLSLSKYKRGIVAGVPEKTLVAHKFGERSFPESNIKQLHDCGIIYKPDKPYLLCIMTRGHDFKKQEDVISEISKIIYESLN